MHVTAFLKVYNLIVLDLILLVHLSMLTSMFTCIHAGVIWQTCHTIAPYLSRDARKPVFGVSDQVRLKSQKQAGSLKFWL